MLICFTHYLDVPLQPNVGIQTILAEHHKDVASDQQRHSDKVVLVETSWIIMDDYISGLTTDNRHVIHLPKKI